MTTDHLYVTYLEKTPIAVSRYPETAIREATERRVVGKRTYVGVVETVAWLDSEPDWSEDKTDPRCTLCSHGELCVEKS